MFFCLRRHAGGQQQGQGLLCTGITGPLRTQGPPGAARSPWTHAVGSARSTLHTGRTAVPRLCQLDRADARVRPQQARVGGACAEPSVSGEHGRPWTGGQKHLFSRHKYWTARHRDKGNPSPDGSRRTLAGRGPDRNGKSSRLDTAGCSNKNIEFTTNSCGHDQCLVQRARDDCVGSRSVRCCRACANDLNLCVGAFEKKKRILR